MKNKRTLIALALATITLAAACDNGNPVPSNGGTTSASQTQKMIYMIQVSDEDIPVLKANETIDLADYFSVVYMDRTTDKNFTVKVSEDDAASILVEGTKITPKTVGTYDVEIIAGAKSRLVTIDCRSEFNIEVMDFFKALSSSPKNFTMDIMDINQRTGKFEYSSKNGLTCLHNEKYFVWYNKKNPGALASNGEPNSKILALLSDNKGYWGHFKTDGTPEFDPGAVGFDNYIVTQGLDIDGGLFTSSYDPLGEEILTASASVTHALLYYGMPVESDEYVTGETEVMDVKRKEDGTFDYLDLVTYVYEPDDASTALIYAPIRIYALGTSTIESLEAAHTDASYIPAALEANEVVTAFDKIKATGNYTVTTKLEACDSSGKVVANPDDTYAYTQVFGDDPLVQVTKVTAEGIDSTLTAGETATKHAAYFTREGQAFKVESEYDNTTKVLTDTTSEITGVTDARATTEAKAFTADGVTASAINSSVWTKKVENNDGTFTFHGKVGDASDEEVTNAFYKQTMDQMTFVKIGSEESESSGYGSFMCESVDGWTSGEMHAYTINSSYGDVIVNPTTGEMTITAVIMFPASARTNLYWLSTYSISAVGSTTVDWSGYTVSANA